MIGVEEHYKGISFVRISSLPAEQKKKIRQTLNHQLIIKIKREDELLTDCIQYNHYVTWYEQVFKVKEEPVADIELTIPNLAIAS